MRDKIEHKKNTIIESIKRSTRLLTSIILLVIFTLLFVNLKVIFTILDYIPSLSVAILLLIASGLVLIGFYLSRRISINAINRLMEYSDKLRALSLTDELTGIYNRRGFTTLVGHQLKIADRQNTKIFMLYADMDDLKKINDTYGHKEGDHALINFTGILNEHYRTSDIIARIGGDEFVVIPIGTNEKYVETVTNRMLKNIEIYNTKGTHKYELSICYGISYYDPKNPCTVDELLDRADKSMYEQKRQKGKNLT